MKNFEKYYIDRLWDKLDEEYILHFEKDFTDNLTKIKRLYPDIEIAKILLSMMPTQSTSTDNLDTNVNFIETDFSDDTKLSFIEDTKIDQNIKKVIDDYRHLTDEQKEKEYLRAIKDEWNRLNYKNTVTRKSIRIGRLVQKLLALHKDKPTFTASEIERFVNVLISIQKDQDSSYKFEILTGNRIYEAYDRYNYKKEIGHDNDEYRGDSGEYTTTLHQSCMVNKEESYPGILEIYERNPKQIGVLVLYHNNLIVSRAILWNDVNVELENSGGTLNFTFLDRIYYFEEFHLEKMRGHAIKNGWAYKLNNTRDGRTIFSYKGNTKSGIMRIELSDAEFERYPYMDTFAYLDIDNKIISNTKDIFNSYIEMHDTDGDYESYRLITDYKGERRLQSECVFSNLLNIWIWRRDPDLIRYNFNGPFWGNNSDWILKTHPDIITTADGKYCLKKDTMYSKHCDDYYLKRDLIKLNDDFLPKDGSCCSGSKIKQQLIDWFLSNTKYKLEDLPTDNRRLLKLYVDEADKRITNRISKIEEFYLR